MNLLMIIIIVLAIWVSVAICYFAWQLVPKDDRPEAKSPAEPGSAGHE